jgi:hypothetical protein
MGRSAAGSVPAQLLAEGLESSLLLLRADVASSDGVAYRPKREPRRLTRGPRVGRTRHRRCGLARVGPPWGSRRCGGCARADGSRACRAVRSRSELTTCLGARRGSARPAGLRGRRRGRGTACRGCRRCRRCRAGDGHGAHGRRALRGFAAAGGEDPAKQRNSQRTDQPPRHDALSAACAWPRPDAWRPSSSCRTSCAPSFRTGRACACCA